MELDGIIFDLDGVITDTAEYHYRAWQKLADEEGLAFNREMNEQLRGVSRRASLEIILNGQSVPEERVQEMMERKNNYYVESLAQVSPADLCPGAIALLQELRRAGIKVALGSASKNARTVLERLGIAELFDAIADGYSVQRTKPAPDLFLKAAELVGLPPAACAVFEDAAAGVDAALAGGMWAIGIGPAERVGHANLRFDSLNGVTLDAIRVGLTAAAWTVAEGHFDPAAQHHMETVFTTGNGHFCLRGDFEEGYSGSRPACFVHRLWDDMPINFTELANAPRWWGLDLWVDGVRFRLDTGEVSNYRRWLDLRTGVLARTLTWQPAPGGPAVDLWFERCVSLDRPELALTRLRVSVRAGEASVRVRTGLNAHVENTGLLHWNIVAQSAEADLATLHVRTRATAKDLALAAAVSISGGAACEEAVSDADGQPAVERRLTLRAGETMTLEKYVALVAGPAVEERGAPEVFGADFAGGAGSERTQRGESPGARAGPPAAAAQTSPRAGLAQAGVAADQVRAPEVNAAVEPAEPELVPLAVALARAAQAQGYGALQAASAAAWAKTWDAADVLIEGDHQAQIALRFNIFQLVIAAPRWSERASIGAKTLSGFGYRHHVFWDTEIFMLPLFTCADPALARHMLQYRWHNLPAAREKAAGNGFEGAQFPWESAGDGCEVTPSWVPDFEDPTRLVRIWTGDIEIHITADIAYAAMQYWHVTGDDAWLRDHGAELILEGARFWASAARREDDGKYHFRNVIGPDEYHDRIDDNAFTNYIARWHLQTALKVLAWLKEHAPQQQAALVGALDLKPSRLERWREVIDDMYLPIDPETGLIEQFSGYFGLTDCDQALLRDPNRQRSMQVIYGIEGCAATQCLKQPDVLMLQYLLPEEFTPEQVRRNYDYYSPRTDHEYGSSLGPSISAIMACRMGDEATAYEHFMRAARADLYDVRGNAGDGIHGASAGGLWQAAVFGFAGLRLTGNEWHTSPRLPAGWTRLAFKFYHRGRLQNVDVKATS